MELNQTALQSIFNESEFTDFHGIFNDVCKRDPHIMGVLAIGSLVQGLKLPEITEKQELTPRQEAYETIRNRSRRRIFPNINSDLDIWVCTDNIPGAEEIQKNIETRAMEMIEWLSLNPTLHLTRQWVEMKRRSFGEFYKQTYLYSHEWCKRNQGLPWNADDFKDELTKEITFWLPEVVKKINYYFNKKIPGNFLEIRAYPQCTFNLRPEDIVAEDRKDRSPFPRIMNSDWIDIHKNTIVLYASDSTTQNLIYPFNIEGERLGMAIEQFINEF